MLTDLAVLAAANIVTELLSFIRDLSREGESSEQFVWYGERKAQLRCWAMRPSIQADWSQDEVI